MEEDLIRRAQAGESAAFRALVERYTPVAWRVVRALVADRGQAEDVLQEAWIDVWRGLPRFDAARPLRPWLLTIMANRCRMTARRPLPPMLTLNEELAEELRDTNDGIAHLYAHEPGDTLQAALAALAPEQRQVLALRYQAELDLAEIAAVCGLPLSTVKSRLYRTLAVLRTRLMAPSATPKTTETLS